MPNKPHSVTDSVLKSPASLMNAILRNAPILISAKDLKGNVLFTSEHFRVLQGPEPHEYVGKNVFDLFPKDIASVLWENDLKAQKASEPIMAEERVAHADGSMHTYQTAKFRLFDDKDQLIGTCAVSFDITHLKKLEYDVQHDALTELYNRRFLDSCFTSELKRARRGKRRLVFALFDLDNFKQFNDHYGHVKGDDLLVDFSSVLLQHFRRPSDFCFRLGGDEFAVIFNADSDENIEQSLFSVCQQSHQKWQPEFKTNSCSVSVGVRVVEPGEKLSSKTAYRQADLALYQAKDGGRNRVSVFHKEQ